MKKILIGFLAVCLSFSAYPQELYKNIAGAHTGEVLTVSFNKSGTMLLTGGTDKRANLWDAETGKKSKILGHSGAVNGVSFHSGDKFFVTAGSDNRLIIFDGKLMKPIKIIKGHTAPITSVDFDPVGERIASASTAKEVVVWDLNGKPMAQMKGHSKAVHAVAFSPDGQWLASASMDHTVRLWNASTGQIKKTIETTTKGLKSVAFSPDGNYLAAGSVNGSVLVWNATSGALVATLANHKGAVDAVKFTPDARYIFSAGEDNKILVWDLDARSVVEEMPGHSKGITSLDFHAKSNRLVSGGRDGHFMLWDMSSLEIGKKKFAKDAQKPMLVMSGLRLIETNGNGMIEHQDGAAITFTVTNKGRGQAYDLQAKLVFENSVKGLKINKEVLIGNLGRDASQEVNVPFQTSAEMASGAGTIRIEIKEANGNNPEPQKLNFQTQGGTNNYSYVLISNPRYSSGTGKASVGAPITLKLTLQNTSSGEADNIKVMYNFPDDVLAVNKRSEVIPKLGPGESKEVSVEFYATEKFSKEDINIGVALEGAAFSNAKELDLKVAMNEDLPSSTGMIAVAEPAPSGDAGDEPVYRGGGDPLKGLNVAKATEMVIGKYYALIIGVDNYKGTWTPLNNAVNDAKAVENVLRGNYRFDYFRNLYNEKATRANIIREMEWLVANVKPQDNLFIYYSGHGEYKQELNKGYWVPVDATTSSTSQYISNSDIQTFLGGIKSKHTLLISDACFSGDIFRGNTVSVPFEESEKYYKEVHALASRQALTSGGIEPVMDGGSNGHSVFAYYLLKVLKENNRKYFDAGQLYNKIKIPVINNSDQTPKIAPVKKTGDEGGQFIFIRK